MPVFLPSDFNEVVEIPYIITPVAGLQFYDYDERDELRGELIRPATGDRIELVRQPNNRAHGNAVEVRFRNGSLQLGHLPRFLADDIAPIMDAGKHFRAYAITAGNGDAWSVQIMICGEHVPPHRHAETAGKTVRLLDIELARDPAEAGRIGRAKTAQASMLDHRQARLLSAVEALCLPMAQAELEEWEAPETLPEYTAKDAEGRTFGWWDSIPGAADEQPQFRTKTQWAEAGYKLRKGEDKRPAAFIEYGNYRRYRHYKLFSIAQVEAKPAPKLEAVAKGIWLAISTAPAKAEARAAKQEAYEAERRSRRDRYRDYDPDWVWNQQ